MARAKKASANSATQNGKNSKKDAKAEEPVHAESSEEAEASDDQVAEAEAITEKPSKAVAKTKAAAKAKGKKNEPQEEDDSKEDPPAKAPTKAAGKKAAAEKAPVKEEVTLEENWAGGIVLTCFKLWFSCRKKIIPKKMEMENKMRQRRLHLKLPQSVERRRLRLPKRYQSFLSCYACFMLLYTFPLFQEKSEDSKEEEPAEKPKQKAAAKGGKKTNEAPKEVGDTSCTSACSIQYWKLWIFFQEAKAEEAVEKETEKPKQKAAAKGGKKANDAAKEVLDPVSKLSFVEFVMVLKFDQETKAEENGHDESEKPKQKAGSKGGKKANEAVKEVQDRNLVFAFLKTNEICLSGTKGRGEWNRGICWAQERGSQTWQESCCWTC